MVKKLIKQSLNITKTGITLGVGDIVLSGLPTKTTQSRQSLSNIGTFLPTIGTISGGGALLNITKKLNRGKRRKNTLKRKRTKRR